MAANGSMTIILRPQSTSHPFKERECVLDSKLTKVGRSVAKAKPTTSNLIFDCKVLSRNHAVMWCADGQVYLRDTKSSNGTFINNQRLSNTGEESGEKLLKDGDVIQFGVDVMENQRQRVTHGCIIALFVNPSARAESPEEDTVPGVLRSDITELAQILMDARHRQEVMENKLGCVQFDMEQTASAWERECKTFMDEDQLLARIETLENQLQFYTQDQGASEGQRKLKQLEEEKNRCNERAKESLQSMLQEKMEVLKKYSNLQADYDQSEQECDRWKALYEEAHEERRCLAPSLEQKEKECRKLEHQLSSARRSLDELEDVHKPMKLEHQNTIVKMDQMSVDMVTCNDQNKFLTDRLASLQEQMELLHERNTALQSLYDAAKEQGRLREIEIEELRGSLKAKESDLSAQKTHQDELDVSLRTMSAAAAPSQNPHDRFVAHDWLNRHDLATNNVSATLVPQHQEASIGSSQQALGSPSHSNNSHASTQQVVEVSPHPVPLAGVAVAALVSGVVTIGYSYLSLAGVL